MTPAAEVCNEQSHGTHHELEEEAKLKDLRELIESCSDRTRNIVLPIIAEPIVMDIIGGLKNEFENEGKPVIDTFDQHDKMLGVLELYGQACKQGPAAVKSLEGAFYSLVEMHPEQRWTRDIQPRAFRRPEYQKHDRVTKGEGVALRELSPHEVQSLLNTCIEFREAGNKSIKKTDFIKANSQYFQASELFRDVEAEGETRIKIQDQYVLSLRNWAFAALKIEKYNEVVQATDILLALSPDDTKGRYRRGKARWKLGNLEGAATDFEHILSLDLADDDERKAATTALSHLERDQRKADKQMRAIMQKAVAKNVLVEGRDGENKSLSAKQAKDEPNQQERDPQPPVAAQHGVRKTSKPVQKSKSDAVDALTVEDARHIIQELHTLYQTPEIDPPPRKEKRRLDPTMLWF